MKVLAALITIGLAMVPVSQAQMGSTAAPSILPAEAKENPIVWSANQMYARSEKNIIASADEMPAEKYSFHPTADQKSFGWIVSHLAQSNGGLCAVLSDGKAPDAVKVAEAATKPELVAALKASFDFCDTVMTALTDVKLGNIVTFFRGAKVPRARALFELSGDLMDHYSQMAAYLRLSGLLPPSAAPVKK